VCDRVWVDWLVGVVVGLPVMYALLFDPRWLAGWLAGWLAEDKKEIIVQSGMTKVNFRQFFLYKENKTLLCQVAISTDWVKRV